MMLETLEEYDRIISLGKICEPAYQILTNTNKADTDYFDWLVTPMDSVIEAIRTDFDNFDNPEDFIIAEDRSSVLNKRTKIDYRHSFPRDENGLIVETYMEKFPSFLSRSEYLKSKWRKNLSAMKSILFVRREISAQDAVILQEELQVRYKNLRADILCVNKSCESQNIAIDGIYFLSIPTATDGIGSVEIWRERLRNIPKIKIITPPKNYNESVRLHTPGVFEIC